MAVSRRAAHLQQPACSTSRPCGRYAVLQEPVPMVRGNAQATTEGTRTKPPVPFQMTRHSPVSPVSRFTSACWMYGLPTMSTEHTLGDRSTRWHSPDLPGMGTGDVRLSVFPERLCIVSGEVEVDRVRPRLVSVGILGLEDDLQLVVSLESRLPATAGSVRCARCPIWKCRPAAGRRRPEW